MAIEILQLNQRKTAENGRYLRARNFHMMATTAAEIAVVHILLALHMGISGSNLKDKIADGGLYRYRPTQPPTLALYGETDIAAYDPKERIASADQAFRALGGSGRIVVEAYDNRDLTTPIYTRR